MLRRVSDLVGSGGTKHLRPTLSNGFTEKKTRYRRLFFLLLFSQLQNQLPDEPFAFYP